MEKPLLEIKDLKVHFPVSKTFFQKDYVRAVDGVSLTIESGKTLGIIGESGSGKSTLARTIIGLEKPTSGDILFHGESIINYSSHELYELRRNVQMIFQDPYMSLHPKMKVGEIIAAPLKAYRKRGNIKHRVKELMELVGLNPDDHYSRLPHEFSGGQRQRIGIARAIALEPKLIICDEPVSALDVSVQAQIINLLEDLQRQLNLTYLFISHDLSVIKHIADEIAVFYLGKVMETSESHSLFEEPHHPYTKALLSSIPLPDPIKERSKKTIALSGELPSPINPPQGCVFHTRCPFAKDLCKQSMPKLSSRENSFHKVACLYPLTKTTK